jgi:hypothetical protein
MFAPPHFGQGWPNFMLLSRGAHGKNVGWAFPADVYFFNRSANCFRNFATFGATTARQYPANGFFRK